MKLATALLRLSALASIMLLPSCAASSPKDGSSLKLMPHGAKDVVGGYMPRRLELATTRPASLVKAPQMESPIYGELKFGAKSYLLAVDEPEGKPPTLYVDSNGNGDLTDDPATTWAGKDFAFRGMKILEYDGRFQLPLPTEGRPTLVTLGAYRFDKRDPAWASMKNVLMYYFDYGYVGEITLGGKTYVAMLANDNSDGNFRGNVPTEKTPSGTRLMIDINGDRKFDNRAENFDARKPFNIDGITYELTDMTVGGTFRVIKSDQEVPEIAVPPVLVKGSKAIPFQATRTDGAEVNFPNDYKGKLVILDFWATWCGPCIKEMPGLVTTYNELHPKGIDMLGVSLDQSKALGQVQAVTAEKGMTWPQIYDGRFWESRIVKLYGVESIPTAFLIDADTGIIIAAGDDLLGNKLAGTLNNALAAKPKPH